jgi:hypothetical protein
MYLFALAIAAAAVPSEVPQHAPIVVTAQRIRDAESALRDCLARHCAPNEDIDATLALAEAQILDGEYREARTALLHSLSRNGGEAKRYPVPVSDLYRANAKVAANLGLDRDYYRSTWSIYRSLKEGIPQEDWRHYTALFEIAEMNARTRGHTRARYYYEMIARKAREDGRPDIAALADLRSYIRHYPPGPTQLMHVEAIANATDPKLRAPALEARLALARMAFERQDFTAAEAMQKDFARFNLKRPVLIYAPPYEMSEREITNGNDFGVSANAAPGSGGLGNPAGANGGVSATSSLPMGLMSITKRTAPSFDDMWIDVAFRITSDGKVADMQVVRKKGTTIWAKPLLASIRERRYTPADESSPGARRLERYTYTSGYETTIATRVSGRSPQGRVEFIDLSPGELASVD